MSIKYKYVKLKLWIDIHEILFLQQDSAFNEIRKLDDKFEARVCGSFRRGEKIHFENTAWTWQYIYILCDSFVASYQAWKLSIFIDDPIAQYQVLSHILLFCTSAIFIGDADNQRMITGHIQYSSTCFVWDADIDVLMFVIAWYQVPSLVEILIFFLLTQTTPPKPKEKWVYKEINPTNMILLMESLYFFE